MILDELIDQLLRIKTVHGGSMGVVVKQVVIDPPDCECCHYTGCDKRTINVEVESADCLLQEGKCITRKVVIR